MLSEERKNQMREKSLRYNFKTRPTHEYYDAKGYLAYKDEIMHSIRMASIDAFKMDTFPVSIDENDLLAGRYELDEVLTDEMQEELAEIRRKLEGTSAWGRNMRSATDHRVIDYEKLLTKGIDGVLAEIQAYKDAITYDDPACAEKRVFYRSCEIELEAVLRLSARYAEESHRLAEIVSCPSRKSELLRMADALDHVPAGPARTFFEAIQSMWLVQFILARICCDNSLTGRPDQYLYPYYRHDIDTGILDDDTVMSLIEDLYFKHNMAYGNWPASLMVGGRNRRGEPVWNELSYLFIKAIGTTGLVNPAVSVCYNEAMPEDLLELCLDMIAKGYTRPSFFNDDLIIRGLREAGVTPEDANYYIHSTCVEITPIAASNIHVATPYINLLKGLECMLNGGEPLYGNPNRLWYNAYFDEKIICDIEKLDTFDAFFAKLKETIDHILKGELFKVQWHMLALKRYGSSPLSSCFLNDCLALAKDSGDGGARYHFVYPCFPGFVNLVDSVAAIKKAVYEEKITTLVELAHAMENNFATEGRLRAYLCNKCPKFGNDQAEVDAIGQALYLYIKDALTQFRTANSGTFHPSYFAWIMHGTFGEQTAATPDGRLQGEALSECLGAVQGMDKNGPVALMHSVSAIDQVYGIGGIATNVRFGKSLLREGKTAMAAYVREFMRSGNFQLQFNVVDQETLLDAQKHPDKYRTLLVRVAGYSDYFVDLSPIIQSEIISRLEHNDF